MNEKIDSSVWEKKDIRMSKMNANTTSANLMAAFIQCGAFKPKDLKEGFKEFESYREKIFDYVYPDAPSHIEGEQKTSPPSSLWYCSECNAEITERVKDWSETNMGKALCFDCQKKVK